MRKRVGIFGGSFDPPHMGHVEICRYLLDHNDVDEIWVVPCFKHPFMKAMAPFEDRLMMCRFAFGQFGNKVKVMDVEKRLGDISYSLRTVEHLQGENPDIKFSLIMGSDTAKDTSSWKDAEKIRGIVPFLTVPRGPKSHIPDISSTNVRNCIKDGKRFVELVPTDVAVYIVTHGLYS